MKKLFFKYFLLLSFLFFSNYAVAEVLKKIDITGNNRISDETIKVYGGVKLNKDYQADDINEVII